MQRSSARFPWKTLWSPNLAQLSAVHETVIVISASPTAELLARFPGRRTAVTDAGAVTGHRGASFFEPFSARGDVHAPAVQAPVPGQVPAAPLASAGDRLPAARREQMSPDMLTDPVPAPAGETERWEARVTDTGAVAARLPEQQTEEPVQQQILTVAAWLTEAEETGVKLSGAEVARRLGVSPKTGQRPVIDAGKPHRAASPAGASSPPLGLKPNAPT
ncbi:hypothetical protein [Streptomyces sp. NPDC056387]|uniref:hypothetical protein n=1 Tax=Streptomyces sp. NPDC056387 TaxID=3345803 RepID=UPI0035D8D25C